MNNQETEETAWETLEVTIRIRLSVKQREKAKAWASVYEDDLSGFFRRMLDSIPDSPPSPMPPPPVKP